MFPDADQTQLRETSIERTDQQAKPQSSVGQVLPPPRRGSSSHIHQWQSANGGGHTVMIYRSSTHEQLSSLASAKEVDTPYNA